ncbi:MAG TPA: SDR family oxidoreductase [Candidatus Dormibacteraeota bacterium]|jgi:NAD(P)-dependent dehydrogenase (short-subunit alcohol dehydrogenase family)|nr:SDR family oxidoreductase [Candidatus Dormibacteraeota bacterium]
MAELQGKRTLVTGAASGIGRQIAELFVEEGAQVMLQDLNASVKELADGLGCPSITGDVSNGEDVRRAIDAATSAFGGLDVLVSNAGIEQVVSLLDHEEKDFDRILEVNVKSVWFGIKYGAPAIIASGGGNIVNMSSAAGLNGCAMFGAYAATKAAVVSLTRTAAAELRDAGVRVNCVCPAFLDTPMVTERAFPPLAAAFGDLAPILQAKQGRLGTPREAAQAVLFLATDRASFISGAHITVDNVLSERLL